MRLEFDCVRDILLTVEDIVTLETPCFINQNYQQYERLKKYDFSVLAYHVHQCALSELFTETQFDELWNCKIIDLSPKGHEYIGNIRSDNVWSKVKNVIAKIGGVALSMVPEIASPILSAQIQSLLNG